MVTEIPGMGGDVERGMTKEALAKKGMTLLESRTRQVGGLEALFLKVAQTSGGVEFLKLILVAGDLSSTTIVTGTYPKKLAAELEAPMTLSVLSVTWESKTKVNPFDGLLFKMEPTEKLKLAGRIGNLLMFTESGATSPLPPDEARFIVGNSLDSKGLGNLRSFAETRAAATATLRDVKPVDGGELMVDGLKAYKIIASAIHQKTNEPTRLYQVIAAYDTGYFIFQGLVPAEHAQEYLPEFEKLTASFRRNKR